jgi:DNA-binding NtrC family response regulator
MTSAAAMMIERLAKSRPSRDAEPRYSVPLDILVVDDDQATRLSLTYALTDAGHHVTEASDGEEALALASTRTFDVALLDVRLPKIDGLTVFRRLRLRAPTTAIILMTAFATVADAVASLREGAYDYVTKPFDAEELSLRVIGHIAEHVALKRELEEARRMVASRDAGSPIVGHTPAMIRLVERVSTVAQSDAPVLLSGESGTGKGLVAHTLHARGPRKSAPFVSFDCAALPEHVLEVELFGDDGSEDARGGLLGSAHEGTVLLGEISAMPLRAQARLLRVLEQGVIDPTRPGLAAVRVDVRVLSSTRADLKGMVAAGRFREDLFLRISVLDIQIPPLRERRADLPLLVAHFLRRFCPGRVPPGIGSRAWKALSDYTFPGNVRELAQAIERAVVLARGSEIDLDHLPEDIVGAQLASTTDARLEPLAVAAAAFEKDHITRALDLAAGDRESAAELLGIAVDTLEQKMEKHAIVGDRP